MVHQAIELMKARWPEAALLTVLQAAMMVLAEQMMAASETMPTVMMPFWAGFLLGMGVVVCARAVPTSGGCWASRFCWGW